MCVCVCVSKYILIYTHLSIFIMQYSHKMYKPSLEYMSILLAGVVEYADCISAADNKCPGYDIKQHVMVRLQFWSFEECEIRLHCHYSQVHFDPE